MLGEFAVGQSVELTITVTDDQDAAADADDVTCYVMHPDGTTVDTKTLNGGDLTRTGVGTYTLTVTPGTHGKWKVKAASTNPDSASADDFFFVTPTAF